MKVKECFSTNLFLDNIEMKYFYRLTESMILNKEAYGIEIERQDYENGKIINLERDFINVVSHDENRVRLILEKLFNNVVSPIHLVDIVGEVADNCVNEF